MGTTITTNPLAPIVESNGLNCDLCGNPTATANPHGDAPHGVGCIHGDGFTGVPIVEARAIAAERIEQAGGWLASGFLDEFGLMEPGRHLVIDGVLHGYEGNEVLVRATSNPLRMLMVSMATGDILIVERRMFEPFALDCDAQAIEIGATVRRINDDDDRAGTVTNIDGGSKEVWVDFGHRDNLLLMLLPGCRLQLVDTITINWKTTVVESWETTFELTDVAKALDINTDGLTTDQIRKAVNAALAERRGLDTGNELGSLLADEEDNQYGEHCHSSTESRVLRGYRED